MTAGVPSEALPELGPLLGRLLGAPGEKSPAEAALDTVRLELLSALFERAAAARGLLVAGDEAGARDALGRAAWLELWEQAVVAAGHSLMEEIERRIQDAGKVSRYPRERLAAALPAAEERRVLAARLSAAGIGLEEAVERLDDPSREWPEVLRRAAGELEAAWERLMATALTELDSWNRRAAEIRAWRRPWRPLVITGALLLAAATWLGLVLGGFLRAPEWLRPVTNWLWDL